MKEGSNNSDKIGCPWRRDEGKKLFEQQKTKHIVQPVYGGPFVLYTYNVPAYNQQLPIKDKEARQQAHLLIEKKDNRYRLHSFQNNIPVPA